MASRSSKTHQLHLRSVEAVEVQGNGSLSPMTDRKDGIFWFLDDSPESLIDYDSPHFREFQKVSEDFLRGYRRFVDMGFPPEAIGLAMLGATINMYTILEIQKDLPDLFRKLADKMELEAKLH